MTDYLAHMLRHASGNSSARKDIVSYEVALKAKRQIADQTFAFVFEKPPDFQFRAGQHARVTLIAPSETDAMGNSRFLSFASSPDEPDLVWAMRMTDTPYKRALGNMQPGAKVLMQMRLNPPPGAFASYEPGEAKRQLVLLIGGIGIAPAFSMVKDAVHRNLPHTIYLFYSNRRPQDAAFLTELQALAERHPRFKLIATMTEPDLSTTVWQGETGTITAAMMKKYVDDLRTPFYYIAGLSGMVGAMKAILLTNGVQPDRIRAEEFDGFKMTHPTDPKDRNGKTPLPLIGIGLLVLVVAGLHLAGASSVAAIAPHFFSFTNPLAYLMIGSAVVAAGFKIKHIARLLRGRRKTR